MNCIFPYDAQSLLNPQQLCIIISSLKPIFASATSSERCAAVMRLRKNTVRSLMVSTSSSRIIAMRPLSSASSLPKPAMKPPMPSLL